ncbi:hypothetical protein PVAP13_3NG043056 [Panicum virgatum]|uniref:Uncharacterized protein n=1 Tax=Panicum virgatum TaxID=38727 RepID=A0A8T0U1C3_PANVG|nr:hypothetical protein PVAP13_3NG043056 [Panicum virgatum]
MLLNQVGGERRAKVAAHETNGELLPLAAYDGGHGNSEGRRSTWPAASPHGRRRAQHGRRRMWTAVNPAWAAASSGIMASSPPASVNSGHRDSSGRLLGGAHAVGLGRGSHAPPTALVAVPHQG